MSSSKFALINSDYKLTRVDVLVLRQFQKTDEFQKLSVREIYDLADGEIPIGSIRQAMYRLVEREHVRVTKIIQLTGSKENVYYQLTEQVKRLMKFHMGFQDDKTTQRLQTCAAATVDKSGQRFCIQERKKPVLKLNMCNSKTFLM